MTFIEKVKLNTARILLQFSDKLLGKDPESFDKFLSAKAKEQQDKQYEEIRLFEQKEEEKRFREEDEFLLRHREIDFNFEDLEEKSDAMIMFQAELEAIIMKHLSLTSGLVIAGPLVAEAMKLYRTILPQEEYDQIVAHIYQSRNSIEKTILPEDLSSNTVH
jgi:hypothetical protein